MSNYKLILSAAVFGMALIPSGCSDSGANAPTTVVIKPNTSAGGEAAAQAAPGAAAETAAAPASGFGNWKGRVVLQGSVPDLPLLVTKGSSIKDAAVCAAQDVPNEKLVVGKDGGVANVFVFVAKAPAGAKKSDPPAEPVVQDQRGCRFMPHALFIRVGQPLQVISDDNLLHNTNIQTKRGTPFNSPIQPVDRKGITTKFSTFETQPIPVRCDFHGWMNAWHLVLDHPFAAVTDADGNFEIKDLPAGQHRFSVWHEGADFLNRGNFVVDIKPNETTDKDIAYAVEKFKP